MRNVLILFMLCFSFNAFASEANKVIIDKMMIDSDYQNKIFISVEKSSEHENITACGSFDDNDWQYVLDVEKDDKKKNDIQLTFFSNFLFNAYNKRVYVNLVGTGECSLDNVEVLRRVELR